MKLNIIFSYEVNEITGEMKFIGKKEVTVDATETTKKSTTKKQSVNTNTEPIITLDSNKLVLTQGAYDLLQICDDCRIDVKYEKKGKQAIPVVGTDKVFGTKGGNLVTGKLTVSYRGEKFEKLASYGTTFKLEPTDKEGIFYLIGDKVQEEVKTPDELIDIEKELDMDDLETLEDDGFDFSF